MQRRTQIANITCLHAEYLSNQTERLVSRRCGDDAGKVTLRRQRKVAKYERELLRIGDEVQLLQRFVNAQVVAFRKILKKYKVSSETGHRRHQAFLGII